MGISLRPMVSSSRGEECNQEEEWASGVSTLWSQGQRPWLPKFRAGTMYTQYRLYKFIDSINLTYSVPTALGFANFLFLEMFLLGDGKGRTGTASGIGDLGPFL